MTFSWLGPYGILDILYSTCLLRNSKGNNTLKKNNNSTPSHTLYTSISQYTILNHLLKRKSYSKMCELPLECGNQDEF